MNLREQEYEGVRESVALFCRVHKLYDGHIGDCKHCGKRVYWGRNRNGRWAPPFESMALGFVCPGQWVLHQSRCPHYRGALGERIDATPRLIKKPK